MSSTTRIGMQSIFLLLALSLVACETGPTMVRIHNISTHDYQELEVGLESYGTLGAGQTTEYRDFGTAYRYNYVRLLIDAQEYIIQPIDYVGEVPLGEGDFTYEVDVLDLATGSLSIEAVED